MRRKARIRFLFQGVGGGEIRSFGNYLHRGFTARAADGRIKCLQSALMHKFDFDRGEAGFQGEKVISIFERLL